MRLHIPMSDARKIHKHQSAQNLIQVNLDEERVHWFLFDTLVQVLWKIVHDDVQVLFIAFLRHEVVFHLE
jgi:hypothetical protein